MYPLCIHGRCLKALAKARAVILTHNHPSGFIEPNSPDKIINETMVKAGKLLEGPILIHFSIDSKGWGPIECLKHDWQSSRMSWVGTVPGVFSRSDWYIQGK
jgi:hypothetical protein